ncbi:MAG: SDR family NAD(P)-dependent oxidoreductase, partial [Gammaproteobacteria bacterium]
VIIGVGPEQGLGAQLCRRFATHGLHVVAAGRTQAKLDAVVATIADTGGQASGVVADATREADIVALFERARDIGPVRLVIYNAGNNMPGGVADMTGDYFEQAWRIGCFGGFVTAREAVAAMTTGGGTLLFTGASASLRGKAGFGAFAAAKAALRALAQAVAKEAGPAGIHVAHVIVDGAINGDKVRQKFPDYAEKLGASGLVDLAAIVDAYEFLWRQPAGGWSFELDLRTAIESW